MKNKYSSTLIILLVALVAISISIKNFREPDLWWQIRTGEWILEHNEVPKVDVFSYTMQGAEWINIKWGFEVIAAVVAKNAGPESVFIIQALVMVLLVYFLAKTAKLFPGSSNGKINLTAFVFVFVPAIIAMEYRIIGRPEMFSHLLTVIFIYLLLRNRNTPDRWIFLLIPLQLIWANMHEAFAIGIVVIGIFCFAAWVKWWKERREDISGRKKQAMIHTIIFIASVCAVCINPVGIQLLLRPFSIMNQVYENKYTTELLAFNTGAYWQKEAWFGIIFLAVLIVALYRLSHKSKKFSLVEGINKAGFGYVITCIAFLYLALTAYRNIIFFILVSFPAIYFVTNDFITKIKSKLFIRYGAVFSITLLLVFYGLIVSGKYYELTKSRDRFGLEVTSVNNPVGAANWIRENGMTGKKCFSDYLTSSYLMWKLAPGFRTFIDLRDLDVFPPELFNRFLSAVNDPWQFYKLDSLEHFDYVVLFQPQFTALHGYLYNDSIYACKYVDAVAAIYQKTDSFSRDDIFSAGTPVKNSTFANGVNYFLNPFYHPFNYRKVETDYIAAGYYLNVHRFDLAHARADKMTSRTADADKGFAMRGRILFEQESYHRDSSAAVELFTEAENNFLESLRRNKNNEDALIGLGNIYFSGQKYQSALEQFEKCTKVNPDNYAAHVSAGECCKALVSQRENKSELLSKMLSHYKSAASLNPGNPYTEFNIGYTYFLQNDCDNAIRYMKGIKNKSGLNPDTKEQIERIMRQCE